MLEDAESASLLPSILDEKSSPILHVQHAALYPVRLTGLLNKIVKGLLYAFVPQVVRTKYFRDPLPATKLNSTSWLNGLRGLAALVVFNLHYWYAYSHLTVRGFHPYIEGQRYFFQLPPFPLLFDGTISVQFFWSIAGYTCSYKALEAMTKRDYESLFNSFPASVFRRFFRLYLAPITSMLWISLLAYAGAFEPTRPYHLNAKVQNDYFPGPMGEPHPRRFPSLQLQLAQWLTQVHKMGNIWIEFNDGPPLDWHLWTIICEFRGAMHLFIALAGLATCKPYVRIFWLAILGYIYAFQWPHYECLSFFYGAIIAQLNILRKTEKGSAWFSPRLQTVLRTSAYIWAIYLCCYPVKGYRHPTPLYNWINAWIPPTYGRPNGPKLPKQFGSLILIYLFDTIPTDERMRSLSHRLLTCNFAMYLGTIMFGLYLVHGWMLHLFGYMIPYIIWSRTGKDSDFTYYFGLWLGYFVSLVACLWIADVWTREVEGRINRLVKWLETFCFESRT